MPLPWPCPQKNTEAASGTTIRERADGDPADDAALAHAGFNMSRGLPIHWLFLGGMAIFSLSRRKPKGVAATILTLPLCTSMVLTAQSLFGPEILEITGQKSTVG
eukprot:SAG31_NODE_2597_length_5420_cov_16.255403_2_plen_105_part_00